MKFSRYRFLILALGVILVLAALLFPAKRAPATLRTASDLLAVHQAMSADGLTGFLPGDHPRLGNRLQRKRFTSVSILPDMVIATRSATVAGTRFGTSLRLMKGRGTNTWTVWRDTHFWGNSWESAVGTIQGPIPGATATPVGEPKPVDGP